MNLSDEQWSKVSVFLVDSEDEAGGGRAAAPVRQIFEAVLWIRENDGAWQHLPASFPPQQTCYNRWLKWRKSGALDAALKVIASDFGQ
ncbi:transposase [Paraburkholderia hospita]|uniref:transposase n=1 Tax=Paraburkholderia hospita TaxID=169430 RepID=UPI003ED14519